MPNCDKCGDPLQAPRDKDAGGWYRDRCLPCIAEAAPDVEKTPVVGSDEYQEWLDRGDSDE